MQSREKRIIGAVLAAHFALLALYTFPPALVPERLRVIGQAYARPVFHQQWRLFAPDPPLCDCQVELRNGNEDWRSIVRPDAGYLDRRMAQSIARNMQRVTDHGSHQPDPQTWSALQAMVRDIARERPALRFRLVEHCVEDPKEPGRRFGRITELEAP